MKNRKLLMINVLTLLAFLIVVGAGMYQSKMTTDVYEKIEPEENTETEELVITPVEEEPINLKKRENAGARILKDMDSFILSANSMELDETEEQLNAEAEEYAEVEENELDASPQVEEENVHVPHDRQPSENNTTNSSDNHSRAENHAGTTENSDVIENNPSSPGNSGTTGNNSDSSNHSTSPSSSNTDSSTSSNNESADSGIEEETESDPNDFPADSGNSGGNNESQDKTDTEEDSKDNNHTSDNTDNESEQPESPVEPEKPEEPEEPDNEPDTDPEEEIETDEEE